METGTDNRLNTTSDKIYFDGLLPLQKRPTRVSRLESSLKQLVYFQSVHATGFVLQKKTSETTAATASVVFDALKPVGAHSQGFPAMPFLVAAVIETLSNSQYKNIVEVIAGEADSHCAKAARERGDMILTSDSDMLVYDLGSRGAVAFLKELELQLGGDTDRCSVIQAQVLTPREIADRLGLNGLLRLAFEIREDSSVTLQEAMRRSKCDITSSTRSESLSTFSKEYAEEIGISQISGPQSSKIRTTMAKRQHLDPRISEVVLQASIKSVDLLHMYLPFVIEDPTRASAWEASLALRSFAYSLLINFNSHPPERTVHEYSRRGYRIIATEVGIMSCQACAEYAEMFSLRLVRLKEAYCDMPEAKVWRVIGLIEVCRWYTENERTLPSIQALRTLMTGTAGRSLLWGNIHLSAQHQATLYALRIAQQILRHISAEMFGDMSTQLQGLKNMLESLPCLAELLPSRLELLKSSSDVLDMEQLIDFAKGSIKSDNDIATEHSQEDPAMITDRETR